MTTNLIYLEKMLVGQVPKKHLPEKKNKDNYKILNLIQALWSKLGNLILYQMSIF